MGAEEFIKEMQEKYGEKFLVSFSDRNHDPEFCGYNAADPSAIGKYAKLGDLYSIVVCCAFPKTDEVREAIEKSGCFEMVPEDGIAADKLSELKGYIFAAPRRKGEEVRLSGQAFLGQRDMGNILGGEDWLAAEILKAIRFIDLCLPSNKGKSGSLMETISFGNVRDFAQVECGGKWHQVVSLENCEVLSGKSRPKISRLLKKLREAGLEILPERVADLLTTIPSDFEPSFDSNPPTFFEYRLLVEGDGKTVIRPMEGRTASVSLSENDDCPWMDKWNNILVYAPEKDEAWMKNFHFQYCVSEKKRQERKREES